MAEGNRTIEVTEEEFEHLMRLRAEMQRRQAAGEPVEMPPELRRSTEFAMGAVAGAAAYWLYKELLEEEGE